MFSIKLTGEIKDWAKNLDTKVAPAHLQRINRDIFGRIIHAAVTWNFFTEARNRPRKWPPLSITYAKIKSTTTVIKYPMKQSAELGVYPTPFGNINVRTGQLYNTLGTIFRVTPNSITYGTTAPHAAQVASGQTVKRIHVEYTSKTGRDVSYYRDLTKPAIIPPRPFDFIARQEVQAGISAAMEYLMAKSTKKTIIIPMITPWGGQLTASGGRRIYIYGQR